jgi:crotonobetainyl-CoA:carnitine CoA-transferase CaiB-like acyl-CoA transferase
VTPQYTVAHQAPLAGYRVIDLSSGIAGAYSTKLLADGGAEVVKVEPPEGDPLRRWSASGATIPAEEDGALFSFLACSKRSVVADPDQPDELEFVGELLAGADAVVWSRGTRLAEHPSLAPKVLRDAHPHLTITAITPFGLEGPWHDRPATEFTLQAWSGGTIGLGRGWPDRAPISVGGQVGEWLTGTYAALGTMVSRLRAGEGAPGELVDVSMLEATACCMTYHPVSFFDMAGQPMRSVRSSLTPGVHAAKDGLVSVGVGTGQQWLDFCVMVDHPEWMDDPSLFAERAHLAPIIDEWMAERTVGEILELAGLLRIPHAPVGNGATIPRTAHFQARRSLVQNPRDGFDQPAPPFRLSPAVLPSPEPAPRLGEHTERYRIQRSSPRRAATAPTDAAQLPLAGLRVLDMTSFWAGPLCSHVLALLGAEVIHVESTTRPDGTRAAAARVSPNMTQPWERSGTFSGLNTNKKSITLDLRSERGKEGLRRLLATCDVVVENYTPRVLDQLGLDFDGVRAIRPDVVMVRMPGFGLDGPWRDNGAFAFAIEDASGPTWLTGYPDVNPVSPYCLADPNAGIHAVIGLLLGLEHRRRTGDAVLVEAAMVDAALNVAAEQIVEYSAYGALLERAGNRGPVAAPQNIYRTADVDEQGHADSWVAIAAATDEQWLVLRDALGRPGWAMERALLDAAGRRAQHDTIDEHLAAWCQARSGDEIVDCLWKAGVPVGKVMQPHQQGELPQLLFREFFEAVEHPVAGTARHSTLPIRFSGGPQRFLHRHAPLLGEHTRKVLAEVGLTEEELDELEAEGVTGTAPAMIRT